MAGNNNNMASFTIGLSLNNMSYQRALSSTATQTSRILKELTEQSSNFAARWEDITSNIRSAKSVISSMALYATFQGIAAVVGEASSAIATFSSNMETAEIAMKYFVDGSDKAAKSLEYLREMQQLAAETSFTTESAINLSQFMSAMGINLKVTKSVMTVINDAAAATGASEANMSRIVTALGQILTKGRLAAEEIRQLANANIPIYEILQEQMGLTGEQIKNVGNYWIDANESVVAILSGLQKRYKGAADEVAESMAGMVNSVKDNSLMIGSIATSGIYDTFADKLRIVRDALNEYRSVAVNQGSTALFRDILLDIDATGQFGTLILTAVGNIRNLMASISELYSVAKPLVIMFGQGLYYSMNTLAVGAKALADAVNGADDTLQSMGISVEYLFKTMAGVYILYRVAKTFGFVGQAAAAAVIKFREMATAFASVLPAAMTAKVGTSLLTGGIAVAAGAALYLTGTLDNLLASLAGLSTSESGLPNDFEEAFAAYQEEMEKYNAAIQKYEGTFDESFENIAQNGTAAFNILQKQADKSAKKAAISWLASFDEVYKVPEEDDDGDDDDKELTFPDLNKFIEDLKFLFPAQVEAELIMPEFKWDDVFDTDVEDGVYSALKAWTPLLTLSIAGGAAHAFKQRFAAENESKNKGKKPVDPEAAKIKSEEERISRAQKDYDDLIKKQIALTEKAKKVIKDDAPADLLRLTDNELKAIDKKIEKVAGVLAITGQDTKAIQDSIKKRLAEQEYTSLQQKYAEDEASFKKLSPAELSSMPRHILDAHLESQKDLARKMKKLADETPGIKSRLDYNSEVMLGVSATKTTDDIAADLKKVTDELGLSLVNPNLRTLSPEQHTLLNEVNDLSAQLKHNIAAIEKSTDTSFDLYKLQRAETDEVKNLASKIKSLETTMREQVALNIGYKPLTAGYTSDLEENKAARLHELDNAKLRVISGVDFVRVSVLQDALDEIFAGVGQDLLDKADTLGANLNDIYKVLKRIDTSSVDSLDVFQSIEEYADKNLGAIITGLGERQQRAIVAATKKVVQSVVMSPAFSLDAQKAIASVPEDLFDAFTRLQLGERSASLSELIGDKLLSALDTLVAENNDVTNITAAVDRVVSKVSDVTIPDSPAQLAIKEIQSQLKKLSVANAKLPPRLGKTIEDSFTKSLPDMFGDSITRADVQRALTDGISKQASSFRQILNETALRNEKIARQVDPTGYAFSKFVANRLAEINKSIPALSKSIKEDAPDTLLRKLLSSDFSEQEAKAFSGMLTRIQSDVYDDVIQAFEALGVDISDDPTLDTHIFYKEAPIPKAAAEGNLKPLLEEDMFKIDTSKGIQRILAFTELLDYTGISLENTKIILGGLADAIEEMAETALVATSTGAAASNISLDAMKAFVADYRETLGTALQLRGGMPVADMTTNLNNATENALTKLVPGVDYRTIKGIAIKDVLDELNSIDLNLKTVSEQVESLYLTVDARDAAKIIKGVERTGSKLGSDFGKAFSKAEKALIPIAESLVVGTENITEVQKFRALVKEYIDKTPDLTEVEKYVHNVAAERIASKRFDYTGKRIINPNTRAQLEPNAQQIKNSIMNKYAQDTTAGAIDKVVDYSKGIYDSVGAIAKSNADFETLFKDDYLKRPSKNFLGGGRIEVMLTGRSNFGGNIAEEIASRINWDETAHMLATPNISLERILRNYYGAARESFIATNLPDSFKVNKGFTAYNTNSMTVAQNDAYLTHKRSGGAGPLEIKTTRRDAALDELIAYLSDKKTIYNNTGVPFYDLKTNRDMDAIKRYDSALYYQLGGIAETDGVDKVYVAIEHVSKNVQDKLDELLAFNQYRWSRLATSGVYEDTKLLKRSIENVLYPLLAANNDELKAGTVWMRVEVSKHMKEQARISGLANAKLNDVIGAAIHRGASAADLTKVLDKTGKIVSDLNAERYLKASIEIPFLENLDNTSTAELTSWMKRMSEGIKSSNTLTKTEVLKSLDRMEELLAASRNYNLGEQLSTLTFDNIAITTNKAHFFGTTEIEGVLPTVQKWISKVRGAPAAALTTASDRLARMDGFLDLAKNNNKMLNTVIRALPNDKVITVRSEAFTLADSIAAISDDPVIKSIAADIKKAATGDNYNLLKEATDAAKKLVGLGDTQTYIDYISKLGVEAPTQVVELLEDTTKAVTTVAENTGEVIPTTIEEVVKAVDKIPEVTIKAATETADAIKDAANIGETIAISIDASTANAFVSASEEAAEAINKAANGIGTSWFSKLRNAFRKTDTAADVAKQASSVDEMSDAVKAFKAYMSDIGAATLKPSVLNRAQTAIKSPFVQLKNVNAENGISGLFKELTGINRFTADTGTMRLFRDTLVDNINAGKTADKLIGTAFLETMSEFTGSTTTAANSMRKAVDEILKAGFIDKDAAKLLNKDINTLMHNIKVSSPTAFKTDMGQVVGSLNTKAQYEKILASDGEAAAAKWLTKQSETATNYGASLSELFAQKTFTDETIAEMMASGAYTKQSAAVKALEQMTGFKVDTKKVLGVDIDSLVSKANMSIVSEAGAELKAAQEAANAVLGKGKITDFSKALDAVSETFKVIDYDALTKASSELITSGKAADAVEAIQLISLDLSRGGDAFKAIYETSSKVAATTLLENMRALEGLAPLAEAAAAQGVKAAATAGLKTFAKNVGNAAATAAGTAFKVATTSFAGISLIDAAIFTGQTVDAINTAQQHKNQQVDTNASYIADTIGISTEEARRANEVTGMNAYLDDFAAQYYAPMALAGFELVSNMVGTVGGMIVESFVTGAAATSWTGPGALIGGAVAGILAGLLSGAISGDGYTSAYNQYSDVLLEGANKGGTWKDLVTKGGYSESTAKSIEAEQKKVAYITNTGALRDSQINTGESWFSWLAKQGRNDSFKALDAFNYDGYKNVDYGYYGLTQGVYEYNDIAQINNEAVRVWEQFGEDWIDNGTEMGYMTDRMWMSSAAMHTAMKNYYDNEKLLLDAQLSHHETLDRDIKEMTKALPTDSNLYKYKRAMEGLDSAMSYISLASGTHVSMEGLSDPAQVKLAEDITEIYKQLNLKYGINVQEQQVAYKATTKFTADGGYNFGTLIEPSERLLSDIEMFADAMNLTMNYVSGFDDSIQGAADALGTSTQGLADEFAELGLDIGEVDTSKIATFGIAGKDLETFRESLAGWTVSLPDRIELSDLSTQDLKILASAGIQIDTNGITFAQGQTADEAGSERAFTYNPEAVSRFERTSLAEDAGITLTKDGRAKIDDDFLDENIFSASYMVPTDAFNNLSTAAATLLAGYMEIVDNGVVVGQERIGEGLGRYSADTGLFEVTNKAILKGEKSIEDWLKEMDPEGLINDKSRADLKLLQPLMGENYAKNAEGVSYTTGLNLDNFGQGTQTGIAGVNFSKYGTETVATVSNYDERRAQGQTAILTEDWNKLSDDVKKTLNELGVKVETSGLMTWVDISDTLTGNGEDLLYMYSAVPGMIDSMSEGAKAYLSAIGLLDEENKLLTWSQNTGSAIATVGDTFATYTALMPEEYTSAMEGIKVQSDKNKEVLESQVVTYKALNKEQVDNYEETADAIMVAFDDVPNQILYDFLVAAGYIDETNKEITVDTVKQVNGLRDKVAAIEMKGAFEDAFMDSDSAFDLAFDEMKAAMEAGEVELSGEALQIGIAVGNAIEKGLRDALVDFNLQQNVQDHVEVTTDNRWGGLDGNFSAENKAKGKVDGIQPAGDGMPGYDVFYRGKKYYVRNAGSEDEALRTVYYKVFGHSWYEGAKDRLGIGSYGYANGGILEEDGLYRIAEQNKREAIIPLENPTVSGHIGAAMLQMMTATPGWQQLCRVQGIQNGGLSTRLEDERQARIAAASQTPTPLAASEIVEGVLQVIMPMVAQQQAVTETRPPVYVGTLVADDTGLRELNKRMQVIEAKESRRR